MLKKVLCILFVFVLVFSVSGPAFAEDGIPDESTEIGESDMLTPDSPFYFLKRAVESLQLLLTFKAEVKQELMQRLVEERAKELEVLMNRFGDGDLSKRQERQVEKAIERLIKQSERTIPGEEIRESAKTLKDAEDKTAALIAHLELIREKAPEGAGNGLTRAIGNKRASREPSDEDNDDEQGPPDGKGPGSNPGEGSGNNPGLGGNNPDDSDSDGHEDGDQDDDGNDSHGKPAPGKPGDPGKGKGGN
jgi:hypothetical protein